MHAYKSACVHHVVNTSNKNAFFFLMTQVKISDQRSLRSWCVPGTNESTLVTDSMAPLI